MFFSFDLIPIFIYSFQFVFVMVVAMVAVNVMETEASPAEKKAESYQNYNLKAYHPTKVEIVIKKEEKKGGS